MYNLRYLLIASTISFYVTINVMIMLLFLLFVSLLVSSHVLRHLFVVYELCYGHCYYYYHCCCLVIYLMSFTHHIHVVNNVCLSNVLYTRCIMPVRTRILINLFLYKYFYFTTFIFLLLSSHI